MGRAIAGDAKMLLVGALGRLLGRHRFAHAAAGHDVEGAPARSHDQRAAGRDRQRPRGGMRGSLFAADRMIGGLPV